MIRRESIEMEFWCGTIDTAISEAIEKATGTGTEHWFDFNGVRVIVNQYSDLEGIRFQWGRGMAGFIGKDPRVLPYSTRYLTPKQRRSDAIKQAASDKRQAALQAEYDRQAAAKTAALDAILDVAAPMLFTDEAGWRKAVEVNHDGYGACCIRYAEKWARLMQFQIAHGDELENCAEQCSHLADDEGITGFMYGAAVSTLSQTWIFGEQLRRWHNRDTQISNEGNEANESGRVLNPALLSIH